MKEKTLREMIRKQIKTSLKESPMAKTVATKGLARVEKMAGVKMLKKALGQGTPAQQAAGLLQVVQAISGNNPTTGKMLARMIMKGGIEAPAAEAPTTEENYTPGVDDGIGQDVEASIEEDRGRKVAGALQTRMGRVDKTQAMQMMKKTLAARPATQQVDFVIDLINNLDLKGSAKKRLVLMMRQGLK